MDFEIQLKITININWSAWLENLKGNACKIIHLLQKIPWYRTGPHHLSWKSLVWKLDAAYFNLHTYSKYVWPKQPQGKRGSRGRRKLPLQRSQQAIIVKSDKIQDPRYRVDARQHGVLGETVCTPYIILSSSWPCLLICRFQRQDPWYGFKLVNKGSEFTIII